MVKTRISVINRQIDESGFTLIELLICLAIIGLSLYVMVPNFVNRSPASNIRFLSSEIASRLTHARSTAIFRNETITFYVNVKRRELGISNQQYMTIPEDVAIELLVGTLGEEISEEGAIKFFPDGTSSGGRISLTSSGQTQSVEVFWLTGGIHHEKI